MTRPRKFDEPTKVIGRRVPISEEAEYKEAIDKAIDELRESKKEEINNENP